MASRLRCCVIGAQVALGFTWSTHPLPRLYCRRLPIRGQINLPCSSWIRNAQSPVHAKGPFMCPALSASLKCCLHRRRSSVRIGSIQVPDTICLVSRALSERWWTSCVRKAGAGQSKVLGGAAIGVVMPRPARTNARQCNSTPSGQGQS